MTVFEASRRGKKQGNLAELNLEALLEPCRLLLLGDSLNTSKEATNNLLILVDDAPWTQRPWGKLPPLPLPLGGPEWERLKENAIVEIKIIKPICLRGFQEESPTVEGNHGNCPLLLFSYYFTLSIDGFAPNFKLHSLPKFVGT